MTQKDSLSFERGSKAGFLIALGVVYGDIGTSPLYTMQALVRGQESKKFSEIFRELFNLCK